MILQGDLLLFSAGCMTGSFQLNHLKQEDLQPQILFQVIIFKDRYAFLVDTSKFFQGLENLSQNKNPYLLTYN